jgi:hypothetical protein
MSITFWIIQSLLAATFGLAGFIKLALPIKKLIKIKIVSWADRFPLRTVRFIGACELLGSIGLILPWALNIFPILTPVAESALALVQFLAFFHHYKHKEYKIIILNAALLLLALFVAFTSFNIL